MLTDRVGVKHVSDLNIFPRKQRAVRSEAPGPSLATRQHCGPGRAVRLRAGGAGCGDFSVPWPQRAWSCGVAARGRQGAVAGAPMSAWATPVGSTAHRTHSCEFQPLGGGSCGEAGARSQPARRLPEGLSPLAGALRRPGWMEARYRSLCPWGGEASLAEAAGAVGTPGGGWGEGGDQCQVLRGIWVGAVAPPATARPSSGRF